jgi:hypothetical protein
MFWLVSGHNLADTYARVQGARIYKFIDTVDSEVGWQLFDIGVFVFGCLAHSAVLFLCTGCLTQWPVSVQIPAVRYSNVQLFVTGCNIMYFCLGTGCRRHTVTLMLWAVWPITYFMTFSTVQKQILKKQDNCCSEFCGGIYTQLWLPGIYQLNCWIQRCVCLSVCSAGSGAVCVCACPFVAQVVVLWVGVAVRL